MIRVRQMSRGFPRYQRLIRLLIMILFFLFSFGIFIHLAEPKTFTSIFDGIWWAVVTIATVGYGDFAPVTVLGKTIGIILILSGAGLVTSYFGTISAIAVSSELSYLEGRMNFTKGGHIIIVGWNERSKEIIREMKIFQPKTPIVLIDYTLNKHPLPEEVHFIRGHANKDEVLTQANIKKAEKMLITADLRQDEFQTDMFSIITLLAVKGCNPDIFCLVEILTREQISNAFRAGADGIIETNRFASELMVKSLIDKIVPELEMGDQVDEHDGRVELRPIPIEQEWQQLTFRELTHLLIDQNILAAGIEREGKKILKPSLDLRLVEGDILLTLDNQD